ncbi:hypothetical protein LJC68_03500 [Bacteroidales bacterium OttesenSCG-928-B11]|nr:hypothetical protein [Bacteroidales bacterium OttesenSCG-928-B11]
MKKMLPLLLMFIALISCDRSKPDYKSELQGKWICNEINYLITPTNEFFVMDFFPNNNLFLAQEYDLTEGAKWLETNSFTYSIDEETININGTNALGEDMDLSMKIKRVGSNHLDYQEVRTVVNGMDISEGRIFSLYKKEDVSAENFLGSWEIMQILKTDSLIPSKHKIDFKADGSFDLYNYEDAGWVKNEYMSNHYYVHGDILILNKEYIENTPPHYEHRSFTISNISGENITLDNFERKAGSSDLQGFRHKLIRN